MKVTAVLWTLSGSAEYQSDVFGVVCLFCSAVEMLGVSATGRPLHSHPKKHYPDNPSAELFLSKAFSVTSP